MTNLAANDNKYEMRSNNTGKNFSCNNTGKRRKSDFYETPYSMTQQFVDLGLFDKSKTVLEPAAGDGAIVKVLRRNGFNVEAYDQETDFLKETRTVPQIVTNPPFSIANEFIAKAKEVAEERFAMLLPLNYLQGKARFDTIYSDTEYGLKSVHVFVRYPRLGDPLREDGKYHTAMMVYAWYVFERGHSGAPVIGWLDNSAYVLCAADKVAA